MRKKTSLAMALLPNPRALLLDEPFEAIDPATSKSMRDLFVAAAARGVTVLFTSHLLSVVEQIATQVIVMQHGRVVWNAPSDPLTLGASAGLLAIVAMMAALVPSWRATRIDPAVVLRG